MYVCVCVYVRVARMHNWKLCFSMSKNPFVIFDDAKLWHKKRRRK